MFEMTVRYVIVCLVLLGLGCFMAYADQTLPTPIGAPMSKPPTRVSPQDLETMKLAQCESANDSLVRENLELRKRLADQDAAMHADRVHKLTTKYMLDERTVVKDDGTIERPAPAPTNPPPADAAPTPPAAPSKPAAAAPPPKKKR